MPHNCNHIGFNCIICDLNTHINVFVIYLRIFASPATHGGNLELTSSAVQCRHRRRCHCLEHISVLLMQDDQTCCGGTSWHGVVCGTRTRSL